MKRFPTLALMLVVLLGLTACIRHTPESRLESAFSYVQEGDFINAYIDFKKFVEDYPEHEDVSLAARWEGDCLYRRGYFEKAADQYQEVMDKYPEATEDVTQAWLGLATARRDMGEATEALEIAQNLMESEYAEESMFQGRSTVKGQAASFIGRTYVAMGQAPKAIDYFEIYQEEARAPYDKTYSAQLLADAFVASGSLEKAIDVYEELLRNEATMDQMVPRIGISLAQIYGQQDQLDDAVRVYDQILEATGLPPEQRQGLLQMKASAYVAGGSAEEALAVYDTILEATGLNPTYRLEVKTYMSDAHAAAEQFGQAIAAIEEVLNASGSLADADVPFLKMRLANLHSMDGDRDRAVEIYQQLRRQFPGTPYALRGHVMEATLFRDEEPEKAEEIFNEAIKGLRQVTGATETVEQLSVAMFAQLNIVYAYKDWEDYDQALTYVEQGMEIFDPDREMYEDPQLQRNYEFVSSRYRMFAEQEKADLLERLGRAPATADGENVGAEPAPEDSEAVASGTKNEGSEN